MVFATQKSIALKQNRGCEPRQTNTSKFDKNERCIIHSSIVRNENPALRALIWAG